MADWTLREGRPDDVPRAMELVKTSPYLECHTEHTYWILFNYGRRYVVVAETPEDGMVGFISGVRSTIDPALLFVWQMVVDPGRRGGRVAWDLFSKLGDEICVEDGCTYWNTAVDSQNKPLLTSLLAWLEKTDRVFGVKDRISYEVTDDHGESRSMNELVIEFRRATDPLAKELDCKVPAL